MTLYANLEFAKRELKTAQPTGAALTADDMRLAGYLRQVSLRLDSEFPQSPRWPFFAPYVGTRKKTVTAQKVNSAWNTFQWSEPLLALTGDITLGNSTLVVGADVQLWPDSSQPPFYQLQLLSRTRSWYDGCSNCQTPVQVSIPGVWGFHRDYANAWAQTTQLNGALLANATTITVDSLLAPDPYGITPGISVGSLLQIDDASGEYLEVVGINPAANSATVLRGVNGTRALVTDHADGAGVLVFQVEAPVQEAVARQAGLTYARRGEYTTLEVQGMTAIYYPASWLVEVRAMMSGYANGF